MTVLTPDRAPAPAPVEPLQDLQPLPPGGQPPLAEQPSPHKKPPRRPWWWYLVGAVIALVVGVATYFAVTTVLGGTSATTPTGNPSGVSSSSTQAQRGLLSVPGYYYVSPPLKGAAVSDSALAQLNARAHRANPQYPFKVFTSSTIRGVVTQPGEEPGMMLWLIQVNPRVMRNAPPQAARQFVAGMAGGMAAQGSSVTIRTINGVQVAVAHRSDGGAIYAWFQHNTVHMVMSPDDSAAGTFTAAYLQTASAS